jgi:hypothetical protein
VCSFAESISSLLFLHIYQSRMMFPTIRTTTAPQRGLLGSFALLLVPMTFSSSIQAMTFTDPPHNAVVQ